MSPIPITLEAHGVTVRGQGEEAVVVLGHGLGTDQSAWIPDFVDEFKLVLFDSLDAGTTDPEFSGALRYSTLYGYAGDLVAILGDLKVDSSATPSRAWWAAWPPLNARSSFPRLL